MQTNKANMTVQNIPYTRPCEFNIFEWTSEFKLIQINTGFNTPTATATARNQNNSASRAARMILKALAYS